MRPVVLRAGAWRLLLLTGVILGMLGLGAVEAHAVAPSSLAGETFTSQEVKGSTLTGTCNLEGGSFAFSVTGTAAGPFPGTFTESGSFSAAPSGFMSDFSATFTITSTVGIVTGTKHWVQEEEPIGSLCGVDGSLSLSNLPLAYTATINGAGHDHGGATVNIEGLPAVPRAAPIFSESFGSAVAPPPPASKAQCKHGGWRSFGTMFKNQGDCVSYVATGGKNLPSGS